MRELFIKLRFIFMHFHLTILVLTEMWLPFLFLYYISLETFAVFLVNHYLKISIFHNTQRW